MFLSDLHEYGRKNETARARGLEVKWTLKRTLSLQFGRSDTQDRQSYLVLSGHLKDLHKVFEQF